MDQTFASILYELRSRDTELRKHGVNMLFDYVQTWLATHPPELANSIWSEVNQRIIFPLTSQSTTRDERLGGIAALDRLLALEAEPTVDTRRNLYRLLRYVKNLLPNPDIPVMDDAAATLGKIYHVGGTEFAVPVVENEVQRAVELMTNDRAEHGRYAGVLILTELAAQASVPFWVHANPVLEKVVIPIRDSRETVRNKAAVLLNRCLTMVAQRDNKTTKPSSFVLILQEAQKGISSTSPDIIQGSLLMYRELLKTTGMFMTDSYGDTCEKILNHRTHKDLAVRKTVISILPICAHYNPAKFTEHFLFRSMSWLLQQMNKAGERTQVFEAIGPIALSVNSEMKSFMPDIMANVREALIQRGAKKNAPPDKAIFECITMLAAAVGPNLTKLLHDQLDLIFTNEFNEHVCNALAAIAKSIQPLLRSIQDRLLEKLSMILSGQPYKPLGAPLPAIRTELPMTQMAAGPSQYPSKNPDTIKLALDTLSSFDFTGHNLNELVRMCALPYLEDETVDIRLRAAVTCCKLFMRDPILHQRSPQSIELINDVLEKLLMVGIADTEPNIRVTVLSNLGERFDKYLAQAENVRLLFMALNGEQYEVRMTTTVIIGRLAHHNPAHVMPSLRKTLVQLLTEMEYTGVSANRIHGAELLTALIRATEQLVKPYALSLLRVLLPKASDPQPTVARLMIECIGLLSVVGCEDLEPHFPEIMSVLLAALKDPQCPPKKQDAALVTMGQVCANTAHIIDPLLEHPELYAIFMRLLKTDTTPETKREVLRVMGILGALDPFVRRKRAPEDDTSKASNAPVNVASLVSTLGTPPEEYFQTVVIGSLLSILRDGTLSSHHPAVIECIMHIFKTQGLKCAAFLPQIIPPLTTVTRNASSRHLDTYIQQLTLLVDIVRGNIRNHLTEILDLFHYLWPNTSLHNSLVALVESLAKALDTDFKPHLPAVLPQILTVFDQSVGNKDKQQHQAVLRVYSALVAFGSNIEEYLHLCLPVIVNSMNHSEPAIRKAAVTTIGGLAKRVNLSEYASRIIHPLIRALPAGSNDFKTAAMDTMCTLVFQLGSDFAIFVPMVKKCLLANRLQFPKYDQLITKLLNGERLPSEYGFVEQWIYGASDPVTMAAESTRLAVNQQHLKQAWDISQMQTREDWREWFESLSMELIKESPSPAIRACVSLVDSYKPLGLDLFNAAFVSCWTELFEGYQDDLVQSISEALMRNGNTDLTGILLSLIEFMEHEDKSLPLDNGVLGDIAIQAQIPAKALHWKELEHFNRKTDVVVEQLVGINTQLQLLDTAWGILDSHSGPQNSKLQLDPWYEKLGRWQEALNTYEQRAMEQPESQEILLGRLRCLYALGEWESLSGTVEDFWPNASDEQRQEVAPLAAAASWALLQWDAMDEYAGAMKIELPDRAFYRAILAVHRNQFQKAHASIAQARDLLQTELVANEDYTRAYPQMLRVLLLSELEEVIEYKRNTDQPNKQAVMRKTWSKRLQGCQKDIDVWQKILQLRNLVLTPADDVTSWIKLANLCRKSERISLAEKTLNALLEEHTIDVDKSQAPPAVVYAHLKVMWAKGAKEEALKFLRTFCISLSRDIGFEQPDYRVNVEKAFIDDARHLLARSFIKQGQWRQELTPTWTPEIIENVIYCHKMATELGPRWYKAWHSWALCNFEAIAHLESLDTEGDSKCSSEMLEHILSAIEGFFRSISLRDDNTLQDSLRLLTLWFKFGSEERVTLAVNEGASMVSVDTWLEVVPQLIARIQTPIATVRVTINTLLTEVGKAHPQSLIYPLTVASKSSNDLRRKTAKMVMERLKEHSSSLVEQSLTVSNELIRVAILWHELWHEYLEEASRLYFTEHNPEAMITHLEPLHRRMEDEGPQTTRETSFAQVYGKDLREAREACQRYLTWKDNSEMDKAWEAYYGIFRKIERQLPMLTTFDLQFVSPQLLKAENLELAVPGTYRSGKPVIRIAKFFPKLTVFASKQRPRRLSIMGSDGTEYQFLLKGHEDLRQDERVMQLFGLVNTLLAVDKDSFMRDLHIQRYAVIPLAANVGLLRWVGNSDTLHVLIRDYRDSKKILLNIEYRLMLQMAPDYVNLTLLQKVEVFQYALDNTTGQDLYRALWLKSDNSEAWLRRRATYTRSMAVNSMVGHILGLGDRHPSNVLLDRASGKVVHIDFGDCFEVAMTREKFPERIPFRLTRMVVNAMEVSGIEGSFRKTAEITMRVLRENNDSLMAVLEAFVYDPLISWRLTAGQEPGGNDAGGAATDQAKAFMGGPNRKLKADENDIFEAAGEGKLEVRNERALAVYSRVQKKLTGRDFDPNVELTVKDQVQKLIEQATAVENLCQSFLGWCAFW